MAIKNRQFAEIKLENVRLNFPNLFTPRQVQGRGDPIYSCGFIVDANQWYQKIEEAKANNPSLELKATPLNWEGKRMPNDNAYTWTKWGSDPKHGDVEEGYVLVNANERQDYPPIVLSMEGKQLTTQNHAGEVYGGVYATVIIRLFQRDLPSVGYSCGIKGVRIIKDGPRFGGGRPSVESVAAELGLDPGAVQTAPAAPAPAAPAPFDL